VLVGAFDRSPESPGGIAEASRWEDNMTATETPPDDTRTWTIREVVGTMVIVAGDAEHCVEGGIAVDAADVTLLERRFSVFGLRDARGATFPTASEITHGEAAVKALLAELRQLDLQGPAEPRMKLITDTGEVVRVSVTESSNGTGWLVRITRPGCTEEDDELFSILGVEWPDAKAMIRAYADSRSARRLEEV
jgi:hypothetical protein